MLRQVLTAVTRGASAFGGDAPIGLELAVRGRRSSVSIVALRPHAGRADAVLLECALGVGQAVTGHAPVTRYECLPRHGGWIVLERNAPAIEPVPIDRGDVYVTQVRPHPRSETVGRVRAAAAHGETMLRIPAQVVLGGSGAADPRCLRHFRSMKRGTDTCRRSTIRSGRPCRWSRSIASACSAIRRSCSSTRAWSCWQWIRRISPKLRALEGQSPLLHFEYDDVSRTLGVGTADGGPSRFVVSGSTVEPIVRMIGDTVAASGAVGGVGARDARTLAAGGDGGTAADACGSTRAEGTLAHARRLVRVVHA